MVKKEVVNHRGDTLVYCQFFFIIKRFLPDRRQWREHYVEKYLFQLWNPSQSYCNLIWNNLTHQSAAKQILDP